MNKALKFKFWNKNLNRFTSGGAVKYGGLCFSENDVIKLAENQEDYIVCQSTGLEDKNGNLIYQGDILKESYVWENKPETDITVVEWLDDCASFAMLHVGFQNDFTFFGEYDVDLKNFEVIGNKFENPELLKAE